ncbi:hypothetical protein [Nonomuraea sp. NPDC050310]|uniref:hypothetical protein n=1 Tax=Nonomuraea sp. NPDC050310 TaxID=3154935 RepID=UPI0033CE8886
MSGDWKTDLRFRVQVLGKPVAVHCNYDVEERVRAAVVEAGISDLVDIIATYLVPPKLAFVPDACDLDQGFYEALTLERWV